MESQSGVKKRAEKEPRSQYIIDSVEPCLARARYQRLKSPPGLCYARWLVLFLVFFSLPFFGTDAKASAKGETRIKISTFSLQTAEMPGDLLGILLAVDGGQIFHARWQHRIA